MPRRGARSAHGERLTPKMGNGGVSWVLTRGTRIVRVSGSALDGTLTDAQKATVGERLLGN